MAEFIVRWSNNDATVPVTTQQQRTIGADYNTLVRDEFANAGFEIPPPDSVELYCQGRRMDMHTLNADLPTPHVVIRQRCKGDLKKCGSSGRNGKDSPPKEIVDDKENKTRCGENSISDKNKNIPLLLFTGKAKFGASIEKRAFSIFMHHASTALNEKPCLEDRHHKCAVLNIFLSQCESNPELKSQFLTHRFSGGQTLLHGADIGGALNLNHILPRFIRESLNNGWSEYEGNCAKAILDKAREFKSLNMTMVSLVEALLIEADPRLILGFDSRVSAIDQVNKNRYSTPYGNVAIVKNWLDEVVKKVLNDKAGWTELNNVDVSSAIVCGYDFYAPMTWSPEINSHDDKFVLSGQGKIANKISAFINLPFFQKDFVDLLSTLTHHN